MQPFRPAATGHHAAGKFIDDHDFAVLHHVMLIAVIQGVRAHCRIQMVHEHDIRRFIQRGTCRQQAVLHHQLFSVFMAGLGQRDLMLFEIHPEIAGTVLGFLRFQERHQGVDLHVQRGGIFGLAGDDQRRARLIDQDRVDLVDDAEIEAAHHALVLVRHHIVAQVIESEFVIGTVGDVGGKRFLLFLVRHLRQIAAHRQAEEAMQAPHPF